MCFFTVQFDSGIVTDLAEVITDGMKAFKLHVQSIVVRQPLVSNFPVYF